MRTILTFAAAMAMAALTWGAGPSTTTPPAKKKAPARKTGAASAARKPLTKKPASGATATAAARHGKKGPVKSSTTWRNRQTAPTSDRYKEIQAALVDKGYLPSEEATGTWNPASADALKKFQAEQNLDSNGKINSLSLIALGLGPRHDAPPARPSVEASASQPESGRN